MKIFPAGKAAPIIALALCALAVPAAIQAKSSVQRPERKPDLGDMMEGTYHGDVTSDSRGSSHDDVTLTLTRVGVNQVRITSDYARLPVVTVRIRRAMQSIVDAGGSTSFAYDTTRRPPTLDVSFNNEVSWAGVKVATGPVR